MTLVNNKKKTKINYKFICNCWVDNEVGCVCVSAGVISGALLYIRDEFKAVDRKTWLQVISIFSQTIHAVSVFQ